MEKLPMCRMCLVEEVRMCIVVNKNLHELYEKLTDNPFVTEDIRPILACFFCCIKLKQCYRFLRQCLKAEELFAQRMNEDYEPNSFINQDHLEFSGGFIISPTVHISIGDECRMEDIAIKEEELPAVSEILDDIIEPMEEHQTEELKPEILNNSCLGGAAMPPHHSESNLEDYEPFIKIKTEVEEEQDISKKKRRARDMKMHISIVDECRTEDIAIKEEELPAVSEILDDIIEPMEEQQTEKLELENLNNSCLDVAAKPPHHSESDLEDYIPLIKIKTEVEEEQDISKKKRRARDTKKLELENLNNSCLDVAAKPPHHSESDLEDYIPLIKIKTEVEEEQDISKKKRRAKDTKRATVANKSKLEDAVTAEQTKKEKLDSKVIRTTHKRSPKPGTSFKEPYNHTRRQIGEKPKCDVLQRTFGTKHNLSQHIRMHTGEKPYKCDVCQRSFKEKGSFSRHFRIHTGEKPFECDVCHRSFRSRTSLLYHIRVHTGEKPYTCDVCQHSFIQKQHLSRHILKHTGEKPFKCDVCQRSFRSKTSFLYHIRVHTGERPYKCDVCQSSFMQKHHLSQHIRIHTVKKPYTCDVCQHSFNQKQHLSRHILKHTGEKPYICDVCQRNFSNKGDFSKHFRIHTGEKPYTCDVCQHSFMQKQQLSQHIRKHTGEKPYECDLCQRSFGYKSNLARHIRIHTGKKLYKCDIISK